MTNYRTQHASSARRLKRVTVTMAIICLLATLGYLRSRLWVIDLSYEYHGLQKQLSTIKDENSRLRLDVRQLRSPQRLEKIAREELDLKEHGAESQTKTVVMHAR